MKKKKGSKKKFSQKNIVFWLFMIPLAAVVWAFSTSAIMYAIKLIK